jgi:flagellar protein FliS
MKKNLQSYRTVDTLGKSQLDLILQVYAGALNSFAGARAHYEKEEYNAGYEELEKAKRFLTHLYTTLNPDEGGEVAENLGKLYAFLVNQIQVVQATKELKLIDDSIQILKNLREGWEELKGQVAQAGKEGNETSETPPAASGRINASG